MRKKGQILVDDVATVHGELVLRKKKHEDVILMSERNRVGKTCPIYKIDRVYLLFS